MNKRFIKIIFSFLLFFSTITFAMSNTIKKAIKEKYNVVILGGGVGALTSGIYLSRAGFYPLIIEGDMPGGLITQSNLVENWPGEYQISGLNLAKKLKSHASKNGCVFFSKEVIDVDFSKKPYVITIKDLLDNQIDKISTNSCIIAMGTSSKNLNVEGEKKYWGKGVYNCAICDGSLYKNKNIAIIGGGDSAILEANYLSNIAKNVNVLVRKDKLSANDQTKINTLKRKNNVEIFYNTNVLSINGDKENVKSLTVFDNIKKQKYDLNIDGVFLAIGSKPNTHIFKNKLALDKNGYIKVNNNVLTSVKDVYAIGDIVDPIYKQAITAAADGAKAAILCGKNLNEQIIVKENETRIIPQVFSSSSIIEIKNILQFENELKSKKTPIIVDFYSSRCKPCQRIAPILESHAKMLQGKVKVLKVNVEKLNDIASKYQVKALPTIVIFDKNRNVLFKKMGTNSIYSLLSSLEKIKDKSIDEIESFLQNIE